MSRPLQDLMFVSRPRYVAPGMRAAKSSSIIGQPVSSSIIGQPVSSSDPLIRLDVTKPCLVFPSRVLLEDDADCYACARACDTLIKSVAALNYSLSVSVSIELNLEDGVLQARLDAVAWIDAAIQLGRHHDHVTNARIFANESRESLRLASEEVVDQSAYETTLVGSHCTNSARTFSSVTCRNGAHPNMGRCPGQMWRKDSTRSCGWFFLNKLCVVKIGSQQTLPSISLFHFYCENGL